jgi:hypothetical protein
MGQSSEAVALAKWEHLPIVRSRPCDFPAATPPRNAPFGTITPHPLSKGHDEAVGIRELRRTGSCGASCRR